MKIKRIKYPRTPHLPWSPGGTKDDLRTVSNINFEGKEVVITEKLDGENTTLYCDHLHARSVDSRHHPSRDWVKRLHAGISHNIPVGWRLCGENLYAQHSISYDSLSTYFYLFSIWDENNICMDWDETIEWSELLELTVPKILYRGVWDENAIRNLNIDTSICEGYVVRLADRFHYDEFSSSVAKWVREKHVMTDEHWMHGEVIPNKLKTDMKGSSTKN